MKKNFSKKALVTSVLIAFSLLSMSSFADCENCATTFDVDSAASKVISDITGKINSLRDSIVSALRQHSNQLTANTDKQNAFNKVLTESTQNYDKQYKLQEHVSRINNTYGSADINSPEMIAACEAVALGTNMANAMQTSRIQKEVVSAEILKANLSNRDSLDAARRNIKAHADHFCSSEDVTYGRCQSAAPAEFQNADIKASTLLAPNEEMTYTKEQEIAAKEFIVGITSNGAPITLSPEVERSPAGRLYRNEQTNIQRKIDLAAHSLSESYSLRKPQAGLGAKANLPGNPNASIMKILHSYGNKIFEPNYVANTLTPATEEKVLLAEQTKFMAFGAYMDYQRYLQLERQESMMAAQSIDSIRASSEARITALNARAMQSNAKK